MSESWAEVAGDECALLPRPRRMETTGVRLPVGRVVTRELPAELRKFELAMSDLVTLLGRDRDGPVIPLIARSADLGSECYQLCVASDRIEVAASDSAGLLHAVRTLLDLSDAGGDGALPEVRIEDGPGFQVRGVFVESFAGTDRMELRDWQTLVDRMAQLKLNTLGVSIYGCWDIRHEGLRSEYFFVPLDGYSELVTPQRMITWDGDGHGECELRYLPAMYEGNFFGRLVGYAAERAIEVVPHLGGPGHSTLIPRLVPDLSAVDDKGVRTGYGYCVTGPGAREALARLVRVLVRQHLLPNGLRRLHVAGDEYYPIRNVDPDDRARTVSPYCRCPGCRELTPGQLLVEYLLHIGRVLADDGITMVHWQDTLVREGVLDDYLARLDVEGVPRPVIAWWKYNDPVPQPLPGGTEMWSCPTTGLFPHLFTQDFTSNIEQVLRKGNLAGASGVLAYNLPDPADHANYACLADLAWDLDGSDGAGGFHRRWAKLLAEDDEGALRQGLALARTITSSYPLMMYVVNQVLPYFSTSAAGVTSYPDDVLRTFGIVQPPLADVLRQVVATIREAVAIAGRGRDVRNWPNPIAQWRSECDRLADSLDLFLRVIDAARVPELTDGAVADLEQRGLEILQATARAKPAYLAPAALREHWTFVRSIRPALERLRSESAIPSAETWHAWII
ncbi:glycoside hydrolase family 20 zincin-like fold domain-containing protein [Amycolatopsis thermoflava]|uniref:glycoside hydrolase family 20 zincin-like fold domain-containing protein n=1 Tax=Amycolatopsis thermoflava TaxID=84480 RepID=UPI00364DD30E